MARLGDHPHVLQIFDLGDESGQPYMVLPLMPGGDVETLLEKAEDHRLPLEQAIDLASQICRGLEFAHSKEIVHRDLKPGKRVAHRGWDRKDRRLRPGGGHRPLPADPRGHDGGNTYIDITQLKSDFPIRDSAGSY